MVAVHERNTYVNKNKPAYAKEISGLCGLEQDLRLESAVREY